MLVTTVADLERTILENLDRIPDTVDLVAGVPRSGMLAASLIALHLNVPLSDVGALLDGRSYETGSTRRTDRSTPRSDGAHHVLVVDDLAGTGGTLRDWRERLAPVSAATTLTYCAVYADPIATDAVDLRLAESTPGTVFEWNVLHLRDIKHVALELDGVLCRPPTAADLTDADSLEAFNERTRPRIVPSHRIGRIVTARPERLRAPTERWLERHRIYYAGLDMLPEDGRDAQEFKARHHRRSPYALFIEPDPDTAARIAVLSGKAVWCPSGAMSIPTTARGERRRSITRARARRRARLLRVLRSLWRSTTGRADSPHVHG